MRYDWLPLPDGSGWRLRCSSPATGRRRTSSTGSIRSPAFVASQLANIAIARTSMSGTWTARSVFARSQGGAAIGVELPLPTRRA